MNVPEIDVETLDAQRTTGVKIIDVREPDEYDEAHIPGAILIPLGTVPDHAEAFRCDEPVAVICRSGARSGKAVEWLSTQGIESVNVAGGTLAWIAAGKAIVTGMESGQDPSAS